MEINVCSVEGKFNLESENYILSLLLRDVKKKIAKAGLFCALLHLFH